MADGGIEGDARPRDRRAQRVDAALLQAARRVVVDHDADAHGALSQKVIENVPGTEMFHHQFENGSGALDADVLRCLQEVDAGLDKLTGDLADPAEIFCTSLRLVGRLSVTNPRLAHAVALGGVSHVGSGTGLADRTARDIDRAVAAGQFHVGDHAAALTTAAGGLVSLVGARLQDPAIDAARVDTFAEMVLRMVGLTPAQAQQLATRRLPAWPASDPVT